MKYVPIVNITNNKTYLIILIFECCFVVLFFSRNIFSKLLLETHAKIIISQNIIKIKPNDINSFGWVRAFEKIENKETMRTLQYKDGNIAVQRRPQRINVVISEYSVFR